MYIILAIVTGSLPSVFQGPKNEAEKELILEHLILSNTRHVPNDLSFKILEKNIEIDIFRDRANDSPKPLQSDHAQIQRRALSKLDGGSMSV